MSNLSKPQNPHVGCLEVICTLKSERDALKAEVEEAHTDCIRLQQEINMLRMPPCQLPHCKADRDRWRQLAERMAK